MLSSSPPVVGVTTYRQRASWGPWDRVAALVPASYVASVAAAGGLPVLLPPCEVGDDAAPALVGALDALVLVGGGDIDPARYGQEPHPATAGVDAGRDASEIALLCAALEAELPVLAICRGMQLLNVHLGGTLIQHVPEALGHAGHQPAAGCFADVEVRTEQGTLAAQIVGESTVVRCSHHQALSDVGAGLVVSARAADGLVEAVELASARFVLGVQWHPEEDGDGRLFDALMDSVR
ncbi:MAG TPA: gamma-glutamyl-gamma-aminobutyrate hydrolase family protein [Acidimicrobiales bacterium]|nr:gamma-glutamyl-gamma-aminobutyrate hydrolase family protein [Acidimicrobiales bacterium]